MSIVQFSQAGFRQLLRLAIQNRGREWAKGLMLETVAKNPDAFLDLFTRPSETADAAG